MNINSRLKTRRKPSKVIVGGCFVAGQVDSSPRTVDNTEQMRRKLRNLTLPQPKKRNRRTIGGYLKYLLRGKSEETIMQEQYARLRPYGHRAVIPVAPVFE